MVKDYIIADLNLYNEEQKNKLGFSTFEQMNNWIIQQWNTVVKPEDIVIVMGLIGEGTFEQMRNVITKLNGDKTMLSRDRNDNFSPEEWKEIGFHFCWNCSMVNHDTNTIYNIELIKRTESYKKKGIILVVDSRNPTDDIIDGILFSVCADKWSYNPVDTDEINNIYNNLKAFQELKIDETEHRSDVDVDGGF